jgi:hypothetical protein
VPADRQELADHLAVQRGAARGDPADGVGELVDVGHPVLEQVAHAGRAAAQEFGRVPGLDVLGEHEDRRARVGPAQLERGAQALVGEGRRHPDVRDHHVGPVPGHRGQQRPAVGHRGAHLVALVLEQPDQASPEQRGVLGDHDAHRSAIRRAAGARR